jgi:hypothetical protein
MLRRLRKKTHHQFAENVAPLEFAPDDGLAFFVPHGWKPLEVQLNVENGGRAEAPYVLHVADGPSARKSEEGFAPVVGRLPAVF